MTTDEAIAFAKARGWHVWTLSEKGDGTGWRARMHNPTRIREVLGKPGFNDGMGEYGDGPTPADAILRALCLRIDRTTGKVTEVDVPPFSQAAEGRLMQALSRATEARYLTPLDFINPNTWAALLGALTVATARRSGKR